MFNMKNLFTRALLALMLVTGSGAALAGPIYHVTIDSTGYTGTGAIDFLLSGFEPATDATAFLSNFSGDFLDGSESAGEASGTIGTGLVLGTREGFGSFLQRVNLGGSFGFDLRFDFAPFSEGAGFSVGLISDTLGTYLGQSGNLVAIEMMPGEPGLVIVDASLARVSEVPEPATLASLVLGMALIGSILRARRQG